MLRPVGGHWSGNDVVTSVSFDPVSMFFWSAVGASIEPDDFVLIDNFMTDWLDFGGLDALTGSKISIVSACLLGFGNGGIKKGSFGVSLLLLHMMILLLFWFDDVDGDESGSDEDVITCVDVCAAFVTAGDVVADDCCGCLVTVFRFLNRLINISLKLYCTVCF